MNATSAGPAGALPAGANNAGKNVGPGATSRPRRRIPIGRHICGVILRILLRTFLDVRVINEPRMPKSGAGIVYYNHIHWLDPVLICGRMHRYAVPLTKIEASRWPFVGLLLKAYHVIFITRGVVDRAALKATWEVLADGDISVISPEGTRSADGKLQSAKEGLAFVARQEPDCWLIPSAVTGTPDFKFKHVLINRPKVTVTYGRPFRFAWPRLEDGSVAVPEGRAGRETLRDMTEDAMQELAALLPEDMRGAYNGHAGTNPRWLEFLAG
jgi:1-acyl-sn-glycerol-3-phosphate acyltransferase